MMIDFRLSYKSVTFHIKTKYSHKNPISMEGRLMVKFQFLVTVKVFQACSSVPGYCNALFQT